MEPGFGFDTESLKRQSITSVTLDEICSSSVWPSGSMRKLSSESETPKVSESSGSLSHGVVSPEQIEVAERS